MTFLRTRTTSTSRSGCFSLPASFGPQVLSAGRTFALVMVIVAPFPILVLRSMRLKRIGSKPAIALMVTFLLVTSGFVSATATHDVSPTNYRRGADRRKRIDTGAVRILSRISIAKQYRRDELRVRTPSDRASVERTALGKVIPEFYTGDRVANIQFTGIDGSTDPANTHTSPNQTPLQA